VTLEMGNDMRRNGRLTARAIEPADGVLGASVQQLMVGARGTAAREHRTGPREST